LPDVVKWESLDGFPQESPRITPKEKIKRSPKGRNGISNYGGKMVRNGCYAMQRHYGRRRLGFGTLTLDNADQNWLLVCCWQWAEIVRKFNQELKRELKRINAPTHLIGVTEIQTKRSDKLGFIVPHLHFVYVSWDGESKIRKGFGKDAKTVPDFYLTHEKVKEIFDRVCVNEIIKTLELPEDYVKVNNRVNLQGVKKSAEGYLGKYMSKGAKDVKKYLDLDPNRDDIPSHWWHCTKELRQIVKELIKPVPDPIIDVILENFKELIEAKIIQYCREIKKEIGGVERTIGYAFRLNADYIPTGKNDIDNAFNST
jgi:hypothetical protein